MVVSTLVVNASSAARVRISVITLRYSFDFYLLSFLFFVFRGYQRGLSTFLWLRNMVGS